MKLGTTFGLAGALFAAPVLAQTADAQTATEQADEAASAGERELAELLEGREAGEPVRCLRAVRSDRLRVIDGTAMVFRDGRTLYVNRPNGARFLNDWDVPVFRQFSGSLCRMDQVEMRDRTSLMPGPVLTLGEFVPYTKPAKEG